MKLGPNQTKWLEELRSGKFKQGREYLKTDKNKYCCLGVACEIFGSRSFPPNFAEGLMWRFGNNDNEGLAPTKVVKALALRSEGGQFKDGVAPVEVKGEPCGALTELNDQGWTFKKIANWIEKNPSVVFKKSV